MHFGISFSVHIFLENEWDSSAAIVKINIGDCPQKKVHLNPDVTQSKTSNWESTNLPHFSEPSKGINLHKSVGKSNRGKYNSVDILFSVSLVPIWNVSVCMCAYVYLVWARSPIKSVVKLLLRIAIGSPLQSFLVSMASAAVALTFQPNAEVF